MITLDHHPPLHGYGGRLIFRVSMGASRSRRRGSRHQARQNISRSAKFSFLRTTAAVSPSMRARTFGIGVSPASAGGQQDLATAGILGAEITKQGAAGADWSGKMSSARSWPGAGGRSPPPPPKTPAAR